VGSLLWLGMTLQDQSYQLLTRVIKAERMGRGERMNDRLEAWAFSPPPDLQLTLVYIESTESVQQALRQLGN
jgi:hypothetical protein